MQKDIPSVFQSMVEPPPPPPPQAPAPHPYFKENSDSKAVTKESHKPTENENEIKQDETILKIKSFIQKKIAKPLS